MSGLVSKELSTPVPEQEEAIGSFLTGKDLLINAYAGTGKTTTLEMIARRSRLKGQYLAFNKDIVASARGRFPDHVKTSTCHSIAFRSIVGRYNGDQKKLFGRVNVNATADILNLVTRMVVPECILTGRQQAFLICETVKKFCQSSDMEILESHVPLHGIFSSVSEDISRIVAAYAVEGARKLWGKMISSNDPYPLGHDGYLKLWALSKPKLYGDYILLDECQDTNKVVLGVLAQQKTQMVYVGDRYQQIYEWRGAVNAMETIQCELSSHLTSSFRFGSGLADYASKILMHLGESRGLKGAAKHDTRLTRLHRGTILARTNAMVIVSALDALNRGQKAHIVGGNGEMLEMLRSVQGLREGVPSLYPDFFGFSCWDDVREFSSCPEGEHLKMFVSLVDKQGEKNLMAGLGRTVHENESDLIVSTAHKSKGCEWDNVIIEHDFLKERPQEKKKKKGASKPKPEISASELRLFYVAVTRAKKNIDIPDHYKVLLESDPLVLSDSLSDAREDKQKGGNILPFSRGARLNKLGGGEDLSLPLLAQAENNRYF